jgi:hypothetical protein
MTVLPAIPIARIPAAVPNSPVMREAKNPDSTTCSPPATLIRIFDAAGPGLHRGMPGE